MNLKRLPALVCALTFLALLPASAAPVRDLQMEEEAAPGLNRLLGIVLSAAMLKEENALAEGQAPSEGLVQAAFAVYSYLESGLEQAEVTQEMGQELQAVLFESGAFVMPEKGDCPCVTIEGGKMILDLAELNETPLVGAYVYAQTERGEYIDLQLDLYTVWGYWGIPALDIPEEDLTWYRHAVATVQRNDESPFGFRLAAFALGTIYEDGAFAAWQEYEDADMGFTVSLPSLMGLSRQSAEDKLFENADGSASIRIEGLPPMDYREAAAQIAALPEGKTLVDNLFSVVMRITPRKTVIIIYESDARAYRVTLSYPEE
ncbi:MAG: hypothetical protein IJ174_02785, partial [Clostridia bacterium]|nr:hypothetical protein [Clostridia bacterium]